MSSMVTVRFDGAGALVPDVDGPDPVPSGGTFVTSQARFEELQAQGIKVAIVDEPAPAASVAARRKKEPAK